MTPENIYLKPCPTSFSHSREGFVPALHPELLSGGAESQQLQQRIIESLQRRKARGHCKRQFAVDKPNRVRFNTAQFYLFNIFSTTSTWCHCQLQIGTCKEHLPWTDPQQGISRLPQRRRNPVLLRLPTFSSCWGGFRAEKQAPCSRETGGTGLLDSQIFSGTDFLIPILTLLHI